MLNVLASIRPQHVENILSGKKTAELRKGCPEIPFKAYIYCTKTNKISEVLYLDEQKNVQRRTWDIDERKYINSFLNGRVIGEFICDSYCYIQKHISMAGVSEHLCLTQEQIDKYIGEKRHGGYAWHISDLKIYDTPKELSEFGLKRPPQSWQYIKE